MNAATAAIAIMFPGVRASDIVKGSKDHNVNILVKEQYDPRKNYARYVKTLSPIVTGSGISLLFCFSDGSTMLASDRKDVNKVSKKIVEVHGCVF